MVVSTATRFKAYGLPVGDLIQGNIGLMQAAARFEPERDVRFSTYAAWWIARPYKITSCAIGRLCGSAQRRRKSRCSSKCAIWRRVWPRRRPGPAEVRDRIAEALNIKVKDVEDAG